MDVQLICTASTNRCASDRGVSRLGGTYVVVLAQFERVQPQAFTAIETAVIGTNGTAEYDWMCDVWAFGG